MPKVIKPFNWTLEDEKKFARSLEISDKIEYTKAFNLRKYWGKINKDKMGVFVREELWKKRQPKQQPKKK